MKTANWLFAIALFFVLLSIKFINTPGPIELSSFKSPEYTATDTIQCLIQGDRAQVEPYLLLEVEDSLRRQITGSVKGAGCVYLIINDSVVKTIYNANYTPIVSGFHSY
jgi:hypothetical protein